MEPMQAGLIITAIGMGLVFIAILLLWGLMALMVRIGSPSDVQPAEPVESPVAAIQAKPDQSQKNLAAIAALAVALALQERFVASSENQTNHPDSPWQIIQRARAVQTNASLSSIRQNRRS